MQFRALNISLLSLFLFFAALSASAQVPTSGGLELIPSIYNPAPGQSVAITAKSYSIDINSANITWTAAGKQIAKGIGATTVTVQAPALGKTLNVSVTAVSAEGAQLNSSLSISSGSVDMIVESDGFKPAMFPVKLNPSFQNTVKVTAIPHLANSAGVEYDPKTLLYRWEHNGNALEAQSGYGKQSVIVPNSAIPRPFVMSVTVTTRDENAQSAGYITVTPGQPVMAFYRNDPLYGPLYNKLIGDNLYLGAQREMGVLAVPFGFNAPAEGVGDLELKWFINGTLHPELASNRSVTLRAPEGVAGSSKIELVVSNKKNILQSARSSFQAIFSANATTSNVAF